MLKLNLRLLLLCFLSGSVVSLRAGTGSANEVKADLSNIRVTEIHYHPLDVDTTNDDEYEFIELKNVGDTEISLSGTAFVNGIEFTFGELTAAPNSFVVLASNSEKFKSLYGFTPAGEYSGQLNNGGERIVFTDADGDTVFNFEYDDESPWPVEADGLGYSLVSKSRSGTGDPDTSAYWVISGQLNGSPGANDAVSDVKNITGVLPVEYTLKQNYPNPFNPETNISFSISQGGVVLVKVYDVLGREVKTLLNEEKPAGEYKIKFNAADLASGVYYYRLTTNNLSFVRKMILAK